MVSMATPCDSVIVVANVWRATWKVIGRTIPASGSSRRRQALHQPLLGRAKIGSSDRFLVDASYFSIKNITIGYTIPEKAANYIGMKSVRVYCSMDNLALFTHLKGMNPTYTLTGSTGFVYTPSRSFVAGLDIKF